MKYKIVKDTEGKIVAFGPNDNNYEPHIADGQILGLQDETPILDTTETDAKAAARQAVLDKLGLSADEAEALLG